MKILHISDIHGDIPALTTVKDYAAKKKDLDLIVCSGDHLGQCLSAEEGRNEHTAFSFVQDFIANNLRVEGEGDITFSDILREILTREEVPKPVKSAATAHVELVKKFDENAEKQYEEIADIFEQFPQRVLTVPGNWDSLHYFKFLQKYDIHGETREVGGIKFSGYGSANMIPIYLPYARYINYSGDELHDFLVDEDPDVAVTHVAPRKLQDKGSIRDHDGDAMYLAYVRAEAPMLCLVGHSHEARGIGKDKYQGTYVINSGNLGKYEGSPSSKTFYEIELTPKGIVSAIPYKILSGEVMRDKFVDSINGEGEVDKKVNSSVIEVP